MPPGQKTTNLTLYCPKRTGVLSFYRSALFKGIRTDHLLSDAYSLPFHTFTAHLSLKAFIHVPHPSLPLALTPNASQKVLSGPRGRELPHLRHQRSIQPTGLLPTIPVSVAQAGASPAYQQNGMRGRRQAGRRQEVFTANRATPV